MNVEERLEALFAGWESSKAQALTEFKQQVDRDVDKFLAGFATDKLNKDRMP
jgi:molybdopterin-guanine dinucleotide biosynthesis protein A